MTPEKRSRPLLDGRPEISTTPTNQRVARPTHNEPRARGVVVVIPEKITQGKTTRGVTVLCPFCDRLHSHGWPFDEHEIGLRAPDCSGHGYVIATPRQVGS
jgi:hypothetical protein